jgi:hypothetical protein
MVLWGLAGAGAVLLGGWLATRLSPKDADQSEAPLVLGRSEADAGTQAPAPVESDQVSPPDSANERGISQRRATNVRAAAEVDEALAQAPTEDASAPLAPAPPAVAAERGPDDPKVVGDWGDGFEGAASRDGATRSNARAGAARQAPAGSQAVNLDELPTE